jgi:hypothetical protein
MNGVLEETFKAGRSLVPLGRLVLCESLWELH